MCSMPQGRLRGWLIGLTAWIHNRQLWDLAALGNLFGRKAPGMHTESWLNARISGNITVTKYPCSWTIVRRKRKRRWVIFFFVGSNSCVCASTKLKYWVQYSELSCLLCCFCAAYCAASRSPIFWDKPLHQSSPFKSAVHSETPQSRGKKFIPVERFCYNL